MAESESKFGYFENNEQDKKDLAELGLNNERSPEELQAEYDRLSKQLEEDLHILEIDNTADRSRVDGLNKQLRELKYEIEARKDAEKGKN